MLQILRNKAQSIVIQAIVVIIALVFIFWGVGPNLMNSREAAIVVNDEEITFENFQSAYDRTYNTIRDQFGGNVPQGLLESLGIKDQVVNQLIQDALLRQGATEMGITISKEEIGETINEMVQFQENGSFSMEKYTSLLALNGYSVQKFEEKVHRDMLAQKVSLNIGKFATTATEYEIDDLNRLENSSVVVNYVQIPPREFEDTVAVEMNEVEEWYQTVKENYKTAPEVKLRYLDFSYAAVGEKITIDEAAAQNYYDEHLDEFTKKEMRQARHILFRADENSTAEVHEQQRQKALDILALAKEGKDFAQLAIEYSEGPSKGQGGDLGQFSRGQMVTSFENAAFSLGLNEISDVVKTPFGYHIIKVEKIIPQSITPFAEAKNDIVVSLQNKEAKPLSFQMANEAYEGIISAGSLQAYLEKTPTVSVKETEFFSRSAPPKEIGNDQKFLEAAFSLKEKELSSLVETTAGYAILFAEAIKQPEIPPFAEVAEQVTADYRKDKAAKTANEVALTLLQQAKEKNSLKDPATEAGFEMKTTDYLSKSNPEGGNLPRGLIDAAFKLSANTKYPDEPLTENGSLFVYEFVDRKIPVGTLSEEEKERYRNAIIQRKQQQILTGWLDNRRQQAKVLVHKTLQSSDA
jgi:peptidyl-prolyl cis-trans isomerase D